MPQPPGEIKEIFMDQKLLMEMNDLQTELDTKIGLIAVIADGLSAFSRDCCLSGEDGRRYIEALYTAFDVLSGVNGKLRKQLDCAGERMV